MAKKAVAAKKTAKKRVRKKCRPWTGTYPVVL